MSNRAVPALAALAAMALLSGDEDLSYGALKDKLRTEMVRDPIDTTLGAVMGASVLFYLAERDVNPRIDSLAAAMEFVSTSMSVGYSNIFPETQAGRIIAAAIMAAGPSMTASFLEPPGVGHLQRTPGEATNDVIAEKLDAILQELRAQRTG